MVTGIETLLFILVVAFFCEYIDSSLGMGYGTTLTPVLLLINLKPLMIIPAVLLSELFSGILAGILHHHHGNVNLKLGSKHFKIALTLAICSILGTLIAVYTAITLPQKILESYIGLLVLTMGILILYHRNREYKFSYKKIIGLGTIAAFNKGMSGGGYGPVVTGGQILSGVKGKSAIGITSLAEGLTCLVGVTTYLLIKPDLDWTLAPYLVAGAVLSVPFATFTVKKLKTKKLKYIIGIVTTLLGLFTLIKAFT